MTDTGRRGGNALQMNSALLDAVQCTVRMNEMISISQIQRDDHTVQQLDDHTVQQFFVELVYSIKLRLQFLTRGTWICLLTEDFDNLRKLTSIGFSKNNFDNMYTAERTHLCYVNIEYAARQGFHCFNQKGKKLKM